MNVSEVKMINAQPELFALVSVTNRMTITTYVSSYKMMNEGITASAENIMMQICSSLIQNGIDKFKSTVALEPAKRLAEMWVNAEISTMSASDFNTMIENITFVTE